jgi:DMSO reductase anchor subunit
MKINRNTQIPNMIVYGTLYVILFGVSIWLLAFHKESPTNWVLYVAMTVAVLAGLVKFALHSRKQLNNPDHIQKSISRD